MTDLVANLSTGKGTWTVVNKLINSGDFEKIYLVTNQWTKENFKNEKGAELIVVDNFAPVPAMTAVIIGALKGKLKGVEVALNLTSGSGNEHMAILSALLKMGFAIRLVTYANDKVEEL